MPADEFDWMFDFVLQFLESDKFDAAVMDFVDEKCFLFDDEEENKLIYTDIHQEFCEHIEGLLSTNLFELGITNEMFVDSCEKARHARDINMKVFERLTAMDDFQTFKKIMAKRNTELQLEAIQSFKSGPGRRGEGKDSNEDDSQHDSLLDPDALRQKFEDYAQTASGEFSGMEEEELQDLLFQSLMEMEIIHRQEELEHAELERALQLSLLAEEERLRDMLNDAKFEIMKSDERTSDRKSSGDEETTVKSSSDTKDSKNIDSTNGPQRRASGSVAPIKNATLSDLSESKPLKMRLDSKPLPSIGKGLSSTPLPSIESLKLADEQLDDKRKRTEEAIRSSKEQLMEQRKKEEALRQKLSGVDPEEAQKRAEHMKRQRDLLIAKKKAEREQKVKAEEERKKKKDHEDELDLAENMKKLLEDHQRSDGADAKGLSDEAIAEMRRSTMRLALARRMKMDLIQSEEAKISAMQEEQFSELDKKLQQVEQLREDNRKREYILSKQLERQQAQIARNVKLSASQLDG